jgi:RNA polymerase sigma-70 factor (ECF subfamily)
VTAPKQRPVIPFPSKDPTVGSAAGRTDAVEEGNLVSRCRAGDIDAFETIYRQHAARIYTLACRMAGSPEDGEDLLQEIFLQAYRKLGSFKGDSSLGTWLYRLALNHCLDYVRSRRAKMNKLTETLDAETSYQPVARRDTPVAKLDLERALDRLPDGCREAFVLHDVEGFDHKEVGRLLGIAEGTSKSQVFKARAKLRALLR